jgi:prevent-host-death family protein|tara:strand:+ start:1521 stop:1772 length:252 start_codon:yes stop_codon:yes gene_type:complete
MNIINIAELKSHLSEVITKISQTGDEIIIGKYGKPVAKLVPFSEEVPERKLGFAKHLMFTEKSELQNQVDEPVDSETLENFYK